MESEKVEEIKKALDKITQKHCTTYLRNGKNCKGCENIELNYCDKRLALLTITLINELESKNKRLVMKNNKLLDDKKRLIRVCDTCKISLKQFVERLKEKITVWYPSTIEAIDETLKEFTEVQNG